MLITINQSINQSINFIIIITDESEYYIIINGIDSDLDQ
jgi:hypothetical protein